MAWRRFAACATGGKVARCKARNEPGRFVRWALGKTAACMARAGRKRKAGHRGANGNIKPPTAAERRRSQQRIEEAEKTVVLAQPHRKGDFSQARESPLGRLAAGELEAA